MKICFHLVVWACLCSYFHASAGIITGTVLDHQKQPVEFATITLLKATDSSLVKGEFTDQSGTFVFEQVNEGNYIVTVAGIGFETHSIKEVALISNILQVKLDTITLMPITNELNEVTVVAERPMIQHEHDKI